VIVVYGEKPGVVVFPLGGLVRGGGGVNVAMRMPEYIDSSQIVLPLFNNRICGKISKKRRRSIFKFHSQFTCPNIAAWPPLVCLCCADRKAESLRIHMPYRQNMKLGIVYTGHIYEARCQICAVSHTS